MGQLEVTPGAEYSFGVWVKGSGSVTARVIGTAVEGGQKLGEVSGDAGPAWRCLSGKLKAPGHIRMVTLQLQVGSPATAVSDGSLTLEEGKIRPGGESLLIPGLLRPPLFT